ncbi:uncharacterized protein MELLADRAFT_113407 [Melampsora larici-populina 98AG31]|uniref:DUF4470 domain-containing protein n=1 Tax=Melampsora larici-populina (strain 98AG31 / pathotype 3-4-7) TaxID=747676 RepID=F4S9R9_MELLP|nr:uncharacterized protein MELLADRAFT_113407 [Melampsora larici-populina 98AG31]EGF98561.1 hypothetical protein MELLADRAFT_113407 [Melampsora larici-populina 98AG31]
MSPNNSEHAEQARQRGNAHYKACQFTKAIEAYKTAAALLPADPTPLSNLSAATFEAGDYEKSAQYSINALALLERDTDDDPRKQKLLTRLTKAKRYHSGPDDSIVKESHRTAILGLPRYRPYLTNDRSYYACGHDVPESQYGQTLRGTTKETEVASFMFCGVGDARNMLQTMIHYHFEGPQSSESNQRLHFTILDIKPATIARDLILFVLLDDISHAMGLTDEHTMSQELFETISVASYLYATHVMPAYAWDRIQAVIERLLDSFDNSEQPISWVYIPLAVQVDTRPSLESWRLGPTESYSTQRFRELTKQDNLSRKMGKMSTFGRPDPNSYTPFPQLELDQRVYEDFSIVLPDDHLLIEHDMDLVKMIRNYVKNKDSSEKARISSHIDNTWKPNITLADIVWENENAVAGHLPHPETSFTPFEVFGNLMKGLGQPESTISDGKMLMNVAEFYFMMVGQAIHGLRDRMLVEVCLGEMADCLEKMRYQTLSRTTETKSKDCLLLSKRPHKYHVIHLSNIPDYVGGPLTSFLYGVPLLEHGPGTGVVSCNLRNPASFKTLSQFLCEYLVMYDLKLVQSHFHLKLSPATPESSAGPMPSMQYFLWERIPQQSLTFEQRMPQPKLLHWLYTHFLKICVPYPRVRGDSDLALIFAPLNMTAFLRLLKHVSELGYPAHWISNLIDSIFSGKITTTARPPLQQYCIIGSYNQRCRHILPSTILLYDTVAFGVRDPDRTMALPSEQDIVQYTVKFPDLNVCDGQVPHSMLVFHDEQTFGQPPKCLRPFLIDDITDMDSKLLELRDRGLRCMSTFHLNVNAQEVTFWMSKDIFEEMKEWNVSIWRTDVWEQEDKGLKLGDAVIKKRSWEEWKDHRA